MTTGGFLGAAVGLAAALLIPGVGWALGAAMVGAGFGIGMALDPLQPDIPSPGQPPTGELQITTAEYGLPVTDILGTVKLAGNLLWYCCDHVVEETEQQEVQGGKGGSTQSQTVVTGYKYYLSWALGICLGPVDTLYTIYRNEDVVWSGELHRPVSGGKRSIYIESMETTIEFFYGTSDQEPLTALCRHLAAGNTGGGAGAPVGSGACNDDTNLNIPYRNLCWAYISDAYIGDYNRPPTLRFVVTKRPSITDKDAATVGDAYKDIGKYDYNPAHAVWYVQDVLAGLPKSFMDPTSFAAVAKTLYEEGRGLSISFHQYQEALTYIEAITAHVDMRERYDIDGTLHLKLIRADVAAASLPLIDDNTIVEGSLQMGRKSWIDTYNEIKVIWTERFSQLTGTTEGLCCPSPNFAAHDENPTTVDPDDEVILMVADGCPPFTWEVSGTGFSFEYEETHGPSNTLIADATACGIANITVTDACGSIVNTYICSTQGQWDGTYTVVDTVIREDVCGDGLGCKVSGWGGYHYDICENVDCRYRYRWRGTYSTSCSRDCSDPDLNCYNPNNKCGFCSNEAHPFDDGICQDYMAQEGTYGGYCEIQLERTIWTC